MYARVLKARRGDPLTSLPARLRKGLKSVVREYGRQIQDKIRMSMREPKHGRIYHYGERIHRASAPGEAPAILSGTLYRSIIPIYTHGGLTVKFAPKPIYGKWLEFGTKKILPRPHLVPAFDSARASFRRSVANMIGKMR